MDIIRHCSQSYAAFGDGIVTNYNLEKSYFNSQINAQYYKQSRELLKAHAAQLIREQETKFAKAGVTWQGMVYDKDGNANPGAKLPSSRGVVLLPPEKQEGQEQAPKTPQQADPSAPSTSPNGRSPTPEGQGSNGAEEPNGSANPANVIAGQGGSSEEGEGAAGGSTAAGSTGAATRETAPRASPRRREAACLQLSLHVRRDSNPAMPIALSIRLECKLATHDDIITGVVEGHSLIGTAVRASCQSSCW